MYTKFDREPTAQCKDKGYGICPLCNRPMDRLERDTYGVIVIGCSTCNGTFDLEHDPNCSCRECLLDTDY
jgi:ssDNA-binding Zn-finger/Zn-ribbon topoisomerase 1